MEAEIVETTFVRSRFSDIRHGYDFVPSQFDVIESALLQALEIQCLHEKSNFDRRRFS